MATVRSECGVDKLSLFEVKRWPTEGQKPTYLGPKNAPKSTKRWQRMHLQRYSHDVRLGQRNAKGGKRWWWPGADSTEVKAVGCHEVAFRGTLQSCDCHTLCWFELRCAAYSCLVDVLSVGK